MVKIPQHIPDRPKIREEGEDKFLNTQTIPFEPSTLETIDFAVYDWLNDKMNLSVDTNEGFNKVPIKWVSTERAFYSKNDPEERDLDRTIIYPIITLKRGSPNKNAESRGKYFSQVPPFQDVKGGTITVGKMINQDKTANFVNADAFRGSGPNGEVGPGQINFPVLKKNKKIVYQTITIPKPEYVQIDYSIKLITEYQTQMNELLQPFINNSGYKNEVILERDGHKYEAWIQEQFEDNSNALEMNEDLRKFISTITLKVYGYLVGQDKNDEKPSIVKRENIVEIKIPRERVITGDINEHIEKGFYKP